MKAVYTLILALIFSTVLPFAGISQSEWPKTVTTSDGDLIKVYQWQPEAYANGKMQANAAISVTEKGKSDPVFGMIWIDADARQQANEVFFDNIDVTDIKLPDEDNTARASFLQNALESGMNNWNLVLPEKDINGMLKQNQDQQKLTSGYNNNPPKIIYADKPSLLVVIDGAPKLQKNSKWNLETVVNTPFNILKTNGQFFLYGGKHWYTGKAATGPYAITTNVPSALSAIEAEIIQSNKENNVDQEERDYVISNIIVSTEPAELLQSNGEPEFVPIQPTNLLYIKNSDNDIFMDVSGQQYYVLLSGRWYRSSSLKGKWQYVDADRLPADFAKIPEGSPKDNVLVSVGGTVAARDAVKNAQVPQTAKVDRNNASANIDYDGNPQFEDIDGTDMAYAVNTNGQVLRWRDAYYAVDNGVWFRSYSARGPWVVSVDRPYNVGMIPARYPVYGMKYVHIYDVTSDYIYMGYTPGYLNAYVYGPTVVYGTGYHYRPWFRNHYYARPFTWGFNMHYSPWTGWGFGFNYNMGWFNTGWHPYHNSWGYGWWGPSIYTPAYCWTPYYGGYRHGYFGNHYRGNTVIINNVNVYRNNNIYNHRGGVVQTRDNRVYTRASSAPVRRFSDTRPAGRNAINDGRPSVNRNSGMSPRNSNAGVRRNDGNLNTNRPARNFENRTGNDNFNRQNNSGRQINPRVESNRTTRQFADNTPQRQNNNIQRSVTPRTSERTIRQPEVYQPSQRSSVQPRQQPVQRSVQPQQQPVQRSVQPARQQPVQRSIQSAPSPRVERSSAPRSSGRSAGEGRPGRG